MRCRVPIVSQWWKRITYRSDWTWYDDDQSMSQCKVCLGEIYMYKDLRLEYNSMFMTIYSHLMEAPIVKCLYFLILIIKNSLVESDWYHVIAIDKEGREKHSMV